MIMSKRQVIPILVNFKIKDMAITGCAQELLKRLTEVTEHLRRMQHCGHLYIKAAIWHFGSEKDNLSTGTWF